MPDGLGTGMGMRTGMEMRIPSWSCLHLEVPACINSLGSSQNYISVKRDKAGALDKSGYSAEQTHLTQ